MFIGREGWEIIHAASLFYFVRLIRMGATIGSCMPAWGWLSAREVHKL
jgi:hypothetical protein